MNKSQIIYGTNTGNSQEVSETLKERIEELGIEVDCSDMFDSDPKNMKDLTNVYFCVSTWGEGEPPDDSVDYFNKMKELPDDYLKNIRFAVCGLGDSAYDIFNGFGKDIEIEMNRLGGELITERVDCDIDFEELSDPWIEKIFNHEKGMREPI